MAMTKRLAHVLVRDSLVSSVNLIGTNQFERSGRWQARAWASVDRPANPIAFIFRHYVIVCFDLFQVLCEEGRKLVERNKFHPVVKIYVAGVRNDDQFLWLTGKLVSLFTELSGMGGLTRDEKHRTRRNRLDVYERVKIHEFDVTAQSRVRGECRRAALGRELTSRSAVEVIKLTLNGVGVFIQFMVRSAGMFGLTASKLDISLFDRLFDDLLSLFEGQGMLERIAVGSAHIIHADRRDGLHSRVDLGRADDKAPTSANPKNAESEPGRQMVWSPGNPPQR